MFDLSFWEILVIGIIAVIVVGPERLPGMAYTAGKWITKVKRFVANARAEVESEFNTAELRKLMSAQEEEMQKLRQLMEDTRHDVEQSQHLLSKSVNEAAQMVREPIAPSAEIPPSSTSAAPDPSSPSQLDAPGSKAPPAPARSEVALPAMTAQSIEDEMQALSQSLGETLHRPSFGAAQEDALAAQPTQPSTQKARA